MSTRRFYGVFILVLSVSCAFIGTQIGWGHAVLLVVVVGFVQFANHFLGNPEPMQENTTSNAIPPFVFHIKRGDQEFTVRMKIAHTIDPETHSDPKWWAANTNAVIPLEDPKETAIQLAKAFQIVGERYKRLRPGSLKCEVEIHFDAIHYP